MKRVERVLTKTFGSSFPSTIIGLHVESDIRLMEGKKAKTLETMASYHVCKARGEKGVYDSYTYHDGTTPEEFWNLIKLIGEQCKSLLIVTQNCSSITSQINLWQNLENGFLTLRKSCKGQLQTLQKRPGKSATGLVITEPDVAIVQCWPKQSSCKICLIGIENYGIKIEKKSNQKNGMAKSILDAVLGIIAFLRKHDYGPLKLTAGSQAMHIFRKKYLNTTVVMHDKKSVLDLEMESYVGGRCEVFQIGRVKEKLYHYDFNSSYGDVCASHYLPVRLVESGYNVSPDAMYQSGMVCNAIADVLIDTTSADYPKRRNELVIYPAGRFWTVLAGPELFDAFIKARVLAIRRYAIYEMAPLLKDYASELYQCRLDATASDSQVVKNYVKRLLVSICGKFGQRNVSWENQPDCPADVPYGTWIAFDNHNMPETWRSIAWHCQVKRNLGLASCAAPAVAAWITSLARKKLLSCIRSAQIGNVLYTDTDALIVNAEGHGLIQSNHTVSSGLLGSLRLIGISDDCEFKGIKHYRFGKRVVCAGLQPIKKIVGTEADAYLKRDGPIKFVMAGKRPIASGSIQSFNRSVGYSHGIISDNGRVQPITLAE